MEVPMKKLWLYLLLFLTPLIPIAFYLLAAGPGLDSYSVSIILGVYTFVLVSNQFYFASMPNWLTKTLGTKTVRSLHGSYPILILALALLHAILKLSNGFILTDGQALLGVVAFFLFLIGTISALLLFAQTLLTRFAWFSTFRTRIYTITKLTYKKVRAMHNLMVVAGILALMHIMIASTSALAYNPWGASILVVWMLYSLLSYLNYRLAGRKGKGTK